ncbi:maltose alpha-D-glucosyltransferase [Nitrosomonas sp. Nm34]|uniref:maltose alpha-D-glucosyltransferase n=1 Tax=Nitrosomonas sp. Nm34 TaxID=1881055 RepID=UPI0008DFE488|nr:maltose alpha-D-glucosyltransferase [Nitrosomonas sp. Nm34]SFI18647.1 maltose alpha-D-glucosyltransferase/ alpha-amylase [Nitrosomonas sp. Nm34]
MPGKEDVFWYKDAIIYQLHVRAFSDSNGDGIGDFAGLTSRLDYLKELGVNTLWLLPFFPSPLRDDGYDISDYRGIHSNYGTLADFRTFLQEAHKRDLRVIIELVINHTSDQHPWFQAARVAQPGSAKRNYYVWSDTVKKYEGTRIIFTDTEKSNWAWDEVAQAYYWHRFFSHQPDLNFDNPRVAKAVLRAMRFWFDLGVDGMRLDAIPYLCERDGTNNENLPETHAIIKYLRAELDQHYANRIFLAEANQWPEDVREYFGDGDECHMAFHFPLMPRIFMAVAQEDRHPIIEILGQTPEIPENCQWAVFLRNHDELTLEMVTDRERDYMYLTYASDPLARLNLGIRRRLAPLMEGSRHKIELLYSLLMSLPGSPIIYYGDEIGMGDNIYLGDRNGVRTPMQWSPDRNAGFSRADPQRLYLPPIMDPIYGYETINVEAQSRNTYSLLNWMRHLIATRKSVKPFGRGSIKFLHPGNRKILAYLREYQGESILCVANLANSAQPVELNLAAYKGRVPVELMGRTAFPAIGELPYLLSLPSYSFYWFRLSMDVEAPVWHVDKLPRELLPVLVLPEGLLSALMLKPEGKVSDVLARKTRAQLETQVLPQFLIAQRWFNEPGQPITQLELNLNQVWKVNDGKEWLPLLIKLQFDEGIAQTYFLPLGLLLGKTAEQQYHDLSPWMLAKARQHAREGMLYDALGEDVFCHFLLDAIVTEMRLPFASGEMVCSRTSAFPELPETIDVIHLAEEQSNTSIIYGDQAILKVYRRVQEGINPELEMGQFLTEISPCASVAPLAGSLTYQSGDSVTAIAVLHRYVTNRGTFGHYTQDYLGRYFKLCVDEPDRAQAPDVHAVHMVQMSIIGQRTAELHQALANTTGNAAFDPERQTASEMAALIAQLEKNFISVFNKLEQVLMQLSEQSYRICERLLSLRSKMLNRVVYSPPDEFAWHKTRIHGNYHLDQVLISHNDFVIIDFEGDPNQPLEIRRAKQSSLKDVAGICFSIRATARLALNRHLVERADHRDSLESYARQWEHLAINAFMSGYQSSIAGCCSYPTDPIQAQKLLELFLLEKILDELSLALDERSSGLESVMLLLLDLIEQTALWLGENKHA